jgi:glutamate-1-semialdehyde 2,1-aminomutase
MTFGASCPPEERLARAVVEKLPSIEKVRFASTGTEATMSVVRLARGFTGRDLLVKFDGNYHGHSDTFLVNAGSALMGEPSTPGVTAGVVKDTVSLKYNDPEGAKAFFKENGDRIAAVIVEPVAGNMGVVPAKQPFLQQLRYLTQEVGALLIFDEVITGFRLSEGGAQKLYNITPDLTTLGKIVGGGMPAAAFGGRADIMDYLSPVGKVFQAGTLSGNPVAMEAGYQALSMLKPSLYEELEAKTKIITEGLEIPGCIQQKGSMFTLFFGVEKVMSKEDLANLDTERYGALYRHLLSKGIFFPPSPYETAFVSAVHTQEQLEKTRDIILSFLL